MLKKHTTKKPRSDIISFCEAGKINERLEDRILIARLKCDYHRACNTYNSRLAEEMASKDFAAKSDHEVAGIRERVVGRLQHAFDDFMYEWPGNDHNGMMVQLATAIKSHVKGVGRDEKTLSQLTVTDGEVSWITEARESVRAIAHLNKFELRVMAIMLFIYADGIMSLAGCLACIDYFKEYYVWRTNKYPFGCILSHGQSDYKIPPHDKYLSIYLEGMDAESVYVRYRSPRYLVHPTGPCLRNCCNCR